MAHQESIRRKLWFRSVLFLLTFCSLALFFVSPGIKYSEEASDRDSERTIRVPSSDSAAAGKPVAEPGIPDTVTPTTSGGSDKKSKAPLMLEELRPCDPKTKETASKKESCEKQQKAYEEARKKLPASEERTDDLIRLEYMKGVDEIKLRLEQWDSWYHYKFIVIGGMFALFLGQTGLTIGVRSQSEAKPRKRFKETIAGASAYAMLALAVVISLVIDMHIRNNMFAIQTIGLWIANYVEPSYASTTAFPWEQFLREAHSPSIRIDSLYRIGFSFHLHFMTIAVYLLYVIVLQQICLSWNKRTSPATKHIVVFGFLLVHLTALAFVFVAHAVPGRYAMNLIPSERWETGWQNVGYYILPLIFLIALNLPYLLLGRSRSEKSQAHA